MHKYAILLIAVSALITAALRFLPFLLFRSGKKTPELIVRLGQVLPFAVIGMLVVYCLKDVQVLTYPHGVPELLGCLIVAALHIWKRNSLLSIGVGTVSYMLMTQFLF